MKTDDKSPDIDPESHRPQKSDLTVDVHWPDGWPKWLSKCKDLIEVSTWIVGVTVALITLHYISGQVDSMVEQSQAITEQSKAILDQASSTRDLVQALTNQTAVLIEQNQRLSEQVEISKFENSAMLIIDAFQNKDIVSCMTAVDTSQYRALKDSVDCYIFYFSVSNVGKAPATLELYTFATRDSTGPGEFTPKEMAGLPIQPGKGSIQRPEYIFTKHSPTYFSIKLKYKWTSPTGTLEHGNLMKCGNAYFENGSWHVHEITAAQFEWASKSMFK